jgi:hypothetical protein
MQWWKNRRWLLNRSWLKLWRGGNANC